MKFPTPLFMTFLVPLVSAMAADSKEPPAHTNRLAKEKSPYLLQHAHNPVDWYPWGDEAFAKAAKENKPVLLSIGYATCHWCHVMERESFENKEVAKELNEHFVAIKLDREERPDLDHVYMVAMQGMGLGGGWPLNVFLTPDRKPFFGGTYFPPKAKGGLVGFPDVLERVRTLWAEKEKEIRSNADQLTRELTRIMAAAPPASGGKAPGAEVLDTAAKAFLKNHDAAHGGFGAAPKFPQPQVLAVVLRYGMRAGDTGAVQAVRHTLLKMAGGGITDQLGGGIARYATDAEWLVPHFEKMLYDNAQVASVALDAYAATGDEKLATFARGIFAYVLRDMTSAEGGFCSAEDADSEGHEGKFYTWTKAEMQKLLNAEEAAMAVSYWGVTEKGNFLDHSHPSPELGQNILSVVDAARKLTSAESTLLESARGKLFEARTRRVRPLRDDKVLASWNGLMLSAFARGGAALGEAAYVAAAVKNATFIREKMWDAKAGTLAHRWREGEKDTVQLQRSYAFLLQGVLDVYQTTLDPQWLEWALDIAASMTTRFYDAAHGGFYQGAAGSDTLVRVKEDYDDVEPSGNSAAVIALLQLSALTNQPAWREKAEKTLRFFAPKLAEAPTSLPLMSQAAANAAAEPFRVVLAGERTAPGMPILHRAAFSVYQPHKVVLGTAAPAEEFARGLPARDGKPTAYVCSGTFCHPPTHDALAVREHLKSAHRPGKNPPR